jgi:hypothetical protein
VVIPCQWNDASNFSEDLAWVQDANGKKGYINKTGEMVIPYQWEEAWVFSEGLAVVRDDNYKYGFIDKTGKLAVPCQWNYIGSFYDDLALEKIRKGISLKAQGYSDEQIVSKLSKMEAQVEKYEEPVKSVQHIRISDLPEVREQLENTTPEVVEDIPEEDKRQNVTFRYRCTVKEAIEDIKLTDKNSEDEEVSNIKWIPVNKINNYKWAFNHDKIIIEEV